MATEDPPAALYQRQQQIKVFGVSGIAYNLTDLHGGRTRWGRSEC